jgi:DNA replication protein DnaC
MRHVFQYSRESLKISFDVDFKIDANNKEVMTNLSQYFTGNPEFENKTKKWSLKKGILLFGQVGTGKTTIMRFFKDTPTAYIKLISCRAIADEYSLHGLEEIEQYCYNAPFGLYNRAFQGNAYSYCFDDLGTETIASHYGETRNVMADIILNRYDNSLPFNTTFITTNLSADQIKDLYGLRVFDRMKEMFNLITLKSESRRG